MINWRVFDSVEYEIGICSMSCMRLKIALYHVLVIRKFALCHVLVIGNFALCHV
jgi:hypothetical protein